MRRTRLGSVLLALASLAPAVRAAADEPPPAPAPTPAPAPPPAERLMFDPRFREGKPTDVLVKGDAPLVRETVDAVVDLIEAWLDVSLLADEEQSLRDGLESSWKRLSVDDRRWFDRQAAGRQRLRLTAPADAAEARRALLQAFGSETEGRISKEPRGVLADVVRRARDRRVTVFSAAPEPAVPVAAVDAYEDLVTFLVALARNEATPPTEGQRIAVRPSIRKAMDMSGVAVRRHYARMHHFWLWVKSRWDASDEAGKLRLRWGVLKLFRPIAHLPVPAGTEVVDLQVYARLAAEVAAALPAFDAYTNAFANPGALLTTTVEGLGLDSKDLEPAFSADSLTLR